MIISDGDKAEILSVQIKTKHVNPELIVLELFARGVEELLKDKGNISTRVERMLGTLRDVTRRFRHTPDKKGK